MANPTLKLTTQKRDLIGRKVKSLRRQGIIPANVFGKKVDSVSIQVKAPEFFKLFHQAGETNLIELTIEGVSGVRPVLISSIHRDPVTNQIIHVTFHQVDLKEKVTATVAFKVTGESPAVKEKGGVLLVAISEVEVEALPTDLPDEIVIDISKLADIGSSILAKDLSIDRSKVKINLQDEDTIVVIQEQKAEEEAPAPATEAASGEAPAEGKEGEAPAEGKEAKSEDKKDSPKKDEKSEK